MKFAVCLALGFAISAVSVAQTKTDRDAAGLLGPVKSVQSRSVDYSGDKIVGEGFMKRDGDLIIYDQSGREIDRKPVSDFGEAMGKMSRIFDKQGLLAESGWIDPKGNVIRKNVYSYLNGKLVQDLMYDGKGMLIEKTVNTYDQRGRLSVETYFDPDKPAAKTVFRYGRTARPVEVAFYLADGRKATAPVGPCLGAHRVTYSYNGKGQLIRQAVFETDGKRKKSYRYAYDDKGNTIEYIALSSSSTTRFVYVYKFDSTGNWTKQIATGTSKENGLNVFGKPATPYVRTTVTTREIVYF